MLKKILSFTLCLLSLCSTVIPFSVFAAEEQSVQIPENLSSTDNNSYYSYKSDIISSEIEIPLNKDNIIEGKIESVAEEHQNSLYKNAFQVTPDSNKITYNFSVEKEGGYEIKISYCLPEATGKDVFIGVLIDGEYPFSEAKEIYLPRVWKDENGSKSYIDDFGNEYSSGQVEAGVFQTQYLSDKSGAEVYPYLFNLTQGNHTVSFEFYCEENIVLGQIEFSPAEYSLTYEEISDFYKKSNYKKASAKPIVIEAENASIKSTKSLVAKSDNSSSLVSPADPVKDTLNYIGGSTWKTPGETITWNIDVKETGLYNIGFSYKQSDNINSYSYRWLKIDGETPFSECESLAFDYSIGWNFYTPSDDKEPYQFYLTKGIHTISLSVTLGQTAQYYQMLKNVVQELGDLYIDMAMITGESPDKNRDYNLFAQIPDFNNRLSGMSDTITTIADGLLALSENETTSIVTALNNMKRVLKSMKDNPYSSHNYINDYYDNYTTVSAWLYDMKEMPLSLDRIYVTSSGQQFPIKKSGFFNRVYFSCKRFIAAFSSDYNSYSLLNENKKTLKIWVNWGRDQTMVLNSLITQNFTPTTGINVNLEITNATLVKGILAGNAPDLALHMHRTEPVNLAMRGALCNLKDFNDYNDVLLRFGESSSIPYQYMDGVYALPDTQAFYLMFYRTDILSQLGIDVPKTWDDFLDAVSVLQHNNMNAWIPYTQITTSTTVNAGVGSLNLFPSVLQQYNGSFFNEKLDGCDWSGDSVMLDAFQFWTDMYTKYKLPTTTSFYNRFRVGTTPLGIEVYTVYTQLLQAAPEIDGRWGIALVPGIKQEDGTVNHTVSGSGTGCAILEASNNKDEAWEFLKWWTDADTQLAYNNGVESILGAVSRVTTANLKAFEGMSWRREDLSVLLEQRSWIMEIPEIPGSYYVSRSLDQAFWGVINNSERPKDMLEKWGTIANQEIKRKISEYKVQG